MQFNGNKLPPFLLSNKRFTMNRNGFFRCQKNIKERKFSLLWCTKYTSKPHEKKSMSLRSYTAWLCLVNSALIAHTCCFSNVSFSVAGFFLLVHDMQQKKNHVDHQFYYRSNHTAFDNKINLYACYLHAIYTFFNINSFYYHGKIKFFHHMDRKNKFSSDLKLNAICESSLWLYIFCEKAFFVLYIFFIHPYDEKKKLCSINTQYKNFFRCLSFSPCFSDSFVHDCLYQGLLNMCVLMKYP